MVRIKPSHPDNTISIARSEPTENGSVLIEDSALPIAMSHGWVPVNRDDVYIDPEDGADDEAYDARKAELAAQSGKGEDQKPPAPPKQPESPKLPVQRNPPAPPKKP
jgi:hypothetical protein